MGQNSFSTDPADEFPEVDDYSEVDDLEQVTAEFPADIAQTNGHRPGEQADRAGPDLLGDGPIVAGPVDLTEDGPLDDGLAAARGAPNGPGAAEAESAGHPIDQVAVRKLGGFNFLSIGQWSALPASERDRLLTGGMVMFLFEGDEVPVEPALIWLREVAGAEVTGPDDPQTGPRGR